MEKSQELIINSVLNVGVGLVVGGFLQLAFTKSAFVASVTMIIGVLVMGITSLFLIYKEL